MLRLEKKIPQLIRDCPFKPLPEGRVTWSISKLRCFNRCLRQFFWKYNFGLSSKYTETFFVQGDVFHQGVAEWYAKGGKEAMVKIAARVIGKKLREIRKAGFQDDEDLLRDINTVKGMLIGYSRIYKADFKTFKINPKHIEMWFRVSCGDFDFKGKVDMVASQGKVDVVVEHKALSKFSDSYIETLPMDIEARGYVFGLKHGTDFNPKKVIYNLVKKSKIRGKKGETKQQIAKRIYDAYVDEPDKYFHREPLRYSMGDLATFERDLHDAHDEYVRRMSRKNARIDPTQWRCSDAECKSFGSTCRFLTLCTEGLNRGTAKLYTQYVPKDRRK